MTHCPRRFHGALIVLFSLPGSAVLAADAHSLSGTAWVLADLPGRALVKDASVTLQFMKGTVSGSDGCNRFSGHYSAKKSTLKVSAQMAATLMACPAEVTAQAKAFIAALTGTSSYRIADDTLELLSAGGEVRAALKAQSQALGGSAWRATAINNGKQAVVSVLSETSVTMSFGMDGRVSGSAGCNNYSGPYKSEGASLSFGAAALTRKMCARPDGVMEQEQQFVKALGTVATHRIEGNRLELRTAEGAIALLFTRAD